MNEEEKQNPQVTEEPELPEEQKSPTPLGGRSVFAYLAVLFGAAFLLLLFAYLMQQRDSEEITRNLSDLRESMGSIESIDQLFEENRQLREENEGLKVDNEDLQSSLQSATDALEEAGKAREASEARLSDAYDKVASYACILETLYTAEIKLADRDYEGAADVLTGIEYQFFIDTMEMYDMEASRNPDATLLRPRFDALVKELTEHDALDEDWATPAPPEDKE